MVARAVIPQPLEHRVEREVDRQFGAGFVIPFPGEDFTCEAVDRAETVPASGVANGPGFVFGLEWVQPSQLPAGMRSFTRLDRPDRSVSCSFW